MKIRDEAHYLECLAWLVKEAVRLDDVEEIHDKLMLPERKAELLIKYNLVEQNLAIYRNTMAVRANPDLKAEYRMLGWEFEELEPVIKPVAPAVLPNWLEE